MPNSSCVGRSSALLIATALTGSAVLIAVAMIEYPGGTSWDPTTHGHDFWLNYLCDLEHETALNGEPNVVGARLAQAGLFMLGVSAVPFWWSIPRLFSHAPRLGVTVRGLGAASVAGMMGVALLPSDRYRAVHPVLMALAGLPGLAAGACSVVGLARLERAAAAVGGIALVVASLDLGLYARELSAEGAGLTAVAILERLSLIAVLIWMALVSWRLHRHFTPSSLILL